MLSFRQRIAILIGCLAVSLAALFLLFGPIPQDPAYHAFADARSFFGVPNFGDVASNVGFVAVGVIGVWVVVVWRDRLFAQRSDIWPYIVFFAGVALVSVGSAYYHLEPSNERLLWDRLPMTIAFMAFCAAIVADRINTKAGNTWLLVLLVGIGMLSVVYWSWTESLGRGDLRFYGFVQFFPMLIVPLVCWMLPEHRHTAGIYIFWMIAWYGLAKVAEHFDHQIFELSGHLISGHSLKHLLAAVATLVVVRMLLGRRPDRAHAKL